MTSLILLLAGCNWATEGDYLSVRDHLMDRDDDGDAPVQHGGGDCDDQDPAVNSRAVEVCNGVDDDCDGVIDGEGATDRTTWGLDLDGDGFGREDQTLVQCEQPSGYVANAADCDDDAAAVNPDAQEVCDEFDADEDCDGLADDADDGATGQTAWPLDEDGDGYGTEETGLRCDAGGDYVEEGGDCDDEDAAVNPGAAEVCENGVDDDCDGTYGGCFVGADWTTDDASWRVFGAEEDDRLGVQLAAACPEGSGSPSGLWALSSTAALGDGRMGRLVRLGEPESETVVISDDNVQIIETEDGRFKGGLATCGDAWGDGVAHVAVGASGEDLSIQGGGVVYLFAEDITAPVDDRAAWARVLSEHEDARFGGDIAWSSGLAGGDGTVLVVGAAGHSGSAPDVGAILLFALGESGDLLESDAQASVVGSEEGEAFGGVLEVVRDLNGDGVDDLASSLGLVSEAEAFGEVRVFHGPLSGETPSSAADGSITGNSLYGLLGSTIVSAGDLDGDGLEDLLIGALSDSSGDVDFGGAVYGFLGPLPESGGTAGDAWFTVLGHQEFSMTATVGKPADNDADGFVDLVVGGPFAGTGGEVYFFSGLPGGVVTTAEATGTIAHGEVEAVWGYQVLSDLDLDQDGTSEIISSALHDPTLGDQSGAIFGFRGAGW